MGGRDNLLSARELQARDYLEPVFETFFDTLREVSKRLESEGINRETLVREAEALWRAMPWDRLAEEPAPRRAGRRRTETPGQPAVEQEAASAEQPAMPTTAAADVPPPAPQVQPEAGANRVEETGNREQETGNREQE